LAQYNAFVAAGGKGRSAVPDEKGKYAVHVTKYPNNDKWKRA